MVNKNRKQRVQRNTRKMNPLYRQIPRAPRPRIAFDGSTYSGLTYTTPGAAVGGVTILLTWIDCSSNGILAGNGPQGLYNEYKFIKASLDYIPTIGPTSAEAGDQITVAYIDNPERMRVYVTATSATQISYIRGIKNARTYNAWERFTYNVPLTNRRKIFDVDQTNNHANDDTLDRSTQGLVAVCIVTATSTSPSPGYFVGRGTVQLSGLDLFVPT